MCTLAEAGVVRTKMCSGDFVLDIVIWRSGGGGFLPTGSADSSTLAFGTFGEGKPLSHSSFYLCRRCYRRRNRCPLSSVTPRCYPGLFLRGTCHCPTG